MNYFITLPNQLFEQNILLTLTNTTVLIYEHPLYFSDYNYHKIKIVLHRASMKFYYDYIRNKNISVKYLNFDHDIAKYLKNAKTVQMYDPTDHNVLKEYKNYAKKYEFELILHDSPNFVCELSDLNNYYKKCNKNKKPHHKSFYMWCRKKYNVLMKNNKPIGNKWSFDNKNRNPFPKNFSDDYNFKNISNKYIEDAKKYTDEHFSDNIGSTKVFYLPITFSDAKKHLANFIKTKLNCFGPYQDAVDENIISGCHSLLSPIINVGLLNPETVIRAIEEYYENNKSTKIESVEGFIRQIFWREYVRYCYSFFHKDLENSNYFKHKRSLSKKWFNSDNESVTNICVIDSLVNKFFKYGYLHHIERLMYVGNFMLLTETNPNEVYKWFMCFIDAYPWVMIPNVYGMSQWSAENTMMIRPYFSSSNYIHKMSSFKKNNYDKILLGNKSYYWNDVFDALYYNFINNNVKEFSKIYSVASSVTHWNNKSNIDKKKLLDIAKTYMDTY